MDLRDAFTNVTPADAGAEHVPGGRPVDAVEEGVALVSDALRRDEFVGKARIATRPSLLSDTSKATAR